MNVCRWKYNEMIFVNIVELLLDCECSYIFFFFFFRKGGGILENVQQCKVFIFNLKQYFYFKQYEKILTLLHVRFAVSLNCYKFFPSV